MKIKKVFKLLIFFSILIFISLSTFATNSSEKQASDFQSNGDLIEDWYWLRDSALQNYAEWIFDNIPLGPEEITVKINALATDQPSGGSGFDAKFLLYYSLKGEGPIPTTLIPPQTVTLDNFPSSNDPLGYSCQGQVTIPASIGPEGSRISLRISRNSAQDNHVAFKKDSIVLLTGETPPIEEGNQLPETDELEEAALIQAGTYTGSLGEEREGGNRDNYDYYSIEVEEGQLITLKFTIPTKASYGILLLPPTTHYSRGSVITQGVVKTLAYVADSTGIWYIKINRSSGEGDYQLVIDIQNQNDAASGQDAGKSIQEAIVISSGTITGFLKAGDNLDYYGINLQDGQEITIQLTMPVNANYGISFLNPNNNNRGSVTIQGGMKTLDYVADSTGTWYIRINRNSREGEYQLLVNTSGNNTEEQENNPPVISSLEASQNSVEVNQTVTILCSATDQDIDTFTFIWSVNGEIVEEESSSLNWIAPNSAGNYTISCTVRDSKGAEDSESVSITVTGEQDNNPPVISSLNANWDSIEINHYVGIYCSANDQDGDTLTFNWTVNGQVISGNNSSLTWKAPDTAGTYTITCTVNDGKGGEDSESINIEVTGTQGPELELSLSDEGRALISNLPIFVSETEKGSEIDLDGDGILQEWEDKAMEYINPKFDLDEGEEWFDHPEHHVVNFVRVFPYTKVKDYGKVKYILFTYAVTWSKDYGRTDAGFYDHNGDVESVIMAWEVITADGTVLELRKVFTSAHGGEENDHSAAWDAWNRDCFTRGISLWPVDEEMCGQLVFEENILKLQVSEDKHAIYPTVSCCEDVTLVAGMVMEDCGGGRENPWSFDCYNVGEPGYHLIDDLDDPSSWEGLSENKRSALTNLFPQEQVWSGRKEHPNKFSGGLAYDENCPVSIGNKISTVPSKLEDKL